MESLMMLRLILLFYALSLFSNGKPSYFHFMIWIKVMPIKAFQTVVLYFPRLIDLLPKSHKVYDDVSTQDLKM